MSVTSLLKDDPTVASRYLADQLTNVERNAFEVRLIEDPATLLELEATARMKMGLGRLCREEQLSIGSHDTNAPWSLWLAAAVAVMAVGIGVWRPTAGESPMMTADLNSLVSGGHPLAVGSSHQVLRTRSIRYDATIQLPSTPQAIELSVLPGQSEEGTYYQIVLRRSSTAADEGSAVPGDLFEAGSNGWITIYLDSRRLLPDIYEIVVTPAAATRDEREVFSIQVLQENDQ
jgi:hypothetical protein